MKAVIFAAGKSTRTYPLTLTRPKPLLPIANKPILEHQLDALAGIVDGVVLVVGYRSDMIHDCMGEQYGDIALTYVEQTEQRGTGHALLQCRDALSEPFIAMNGDDLYDAADLAALAQVEQGGLALHVEDPSQFGVYETGDDGKVVRIVEKPESFVSHLANIGAYKFQPEVFSILESVKPSVRSEIEITSAIQALADEGRFVVVQAQGEWLPVGYPWDMLNATTYLLDSLTDSIDGEVHAAAHLTGAVSIGRGTVIRAGVVIDGPVIIGENCHIGPNAWVRPYSAIGDGCKIGQGSEIKGSILMEGTKIPHLSYVGDSVLGANVNFGCGTITANFRHDEGNHRSMVKGELVDTGRRKLGTIVGDGVHTGINTSIYPGRKLWPHTSTLPGDVVKRDIES
jgi:UDP-N-acetylglucosamine diphosphorylase / glucose-1-phosphate thymidylyltransferase / UDP-N-acetylgalactosamine diphosphorylase / glucosamine-1-phosphate N-acetyltransferase / galactosamine-1-phosphate N-acetyltransferase